MFCFNPDTASWVTNYLGYTYDQASTGQRRHAKVVVLVILIPDAAASDWVLEGFGGEAGEAVNAHVGTGDFCHHRHAIFRQEVKYSTRGGSPLTYWYPPTFLMCCRWFEDSQSFWPYSLVHFSLKCCIFKAVLTVDPASGFVWKNRSF